MGAISLAALTRFAAPTYINGALEDGGADVTAMGGAVSTMHDALVSCVEGRGAETEKNDGFQHSPFPPPRPPPPPNPPQYVASAALTLGAATDKALLLLLAFPAYGGHLFNQGVLKPALAAIFASTPEEEEAHAREVARRERARGKAERAGRGRMRRA